MPFERRAAVQHRKAPGWGTALQRLDVAGRAPQAREVGTTTAGDVAERVGARSVLAGRQFPAPTVEHDHTARALAIEPRVARPARVVAQVGIRFLPSQCGCRTREDTERRPLSRPAGAVSFQASARPVPSRSGAGTQRVGRPGQHPLLYAVDGDDPRFWWPRRVRLGRCCCRARSRTRSCGSRPRRGRNRPAGHVSLR